jgi:SagB-type dehydrogenase family enzyme
MRQPGPQVKRSECLVFFFRDGRLHCQNFLTGIEVASAPILIALLGALNAWKAPGQLAGLLPQYSSGSIRHTVRKLLDSTLVVARGSAQHRREKLLAPWNIWGPEAAFFHFASKHAFRGEPPLDDATQMRAFLRESPQPQRVKRYFGARTIRLPGLGDSFESEFPRVLLARRTHRSFAPGSVALEQISRLLFLTWGVTGYLHWPGLGELFVKTSPSGGARQPLEVYLWAFRVSGLPRGIYHYRPDTHHLELVRRGADNTRMARQCARQAWVRDCAALFMMTGVFPRVMWRYRFSRAYRVVLLEAGHFGQTFCLAATWLGLAPFCTAAFSDPEIEGELGLDGASESVLYAVGVGLKRGEEAARPSWSGRRK